MCVEAVFTAMTRRSWWATVGMPSPGAPMTDDDIGASRGFRLLVAPVIRAIKAKKRRLHEETPTEFIKRVTRENPPMIPKLVRRRDLRGACLLRAMRRRRAVCFLSPNNVAVLLPWAVELGCNLLTRHGRRICDAGVGSRFAVSGQRRVGWYILRVDPCPLTRYKMRRAGPRQR